jgi:hypothetical protein
MMHHNNWFGCFQVLMCGQMERQTERQVQKQSRPNMYFTANDHTAVYNVKLPVTQRIFNIPQNATHRKNLKFHLYQQVKYNPV